MSLRRPSKEQPENFDFNPASLEAAKLIIAKYPQDKQQSAVMPTSDKSRVCVCRCVCCNVRAGIGINSLDIGQTNNSNSDLLGIGNKCSKTADYLLIIPIFWGLKQPKIRAPLCGVRRL